MYLYYVLKFDETSINTIRTVLPSLIGLTFGSSFSVLFGVAILRPHNRWFSLYSVPRTTPLPIPKLTRKLRNWLKSDWQKGVMNANQVIKYSLQFVSVDIALNKELNELDPNNLINHVATLSDLIWDWDVLFYTSASLNSAIKKNFIENLLFWSFIKSYFVKEERLDRRKLRFDKPYHIATACFWTLHEASNQKYEYLQDSLIKVEEFFCYLNQIRHSEEMRILVRNLRNFSTPHHITDFLHIPSTQFPVILNIESEKPEHILEYLTYTSLVKISSHAFDILRPQTWILISKLSIAVSQVQTISHSSSRTIRSYALNRALGEITEALEIIDKLPPEVSRVEKPILKNIATRWRDILLPLTAEIGRIEIDKPIANPYTIGDPVIGERFIGREDILRQLEELWFINTSPQSVILYGHRRMGKTSILRNATTKVNTEVRVAYVNLLSVSSASYGITDILMAICDALEGITEIPVPNNNDLLQFPETTFRRYLEQITKTFTGKGLIIALDEFEKIEELIDAGKLSKDFLGFLRGMVQLSSKLAFAFAGLHTLQEMNADYFQPFYASFIPISVAFLTRDATHQVLANPDPEFLLEYEPAALDHIYDLTNGQPYLTQLIGFQLVRMFNDYVFEQGNPRDRTFTIDDVRTICSGENFFTTGINYFNGVWQQASEGATHQQDILKALAPYPQGLTESELISQTNLPNESLQAALKTLKDHDVIRNQKTNEIVNWAIAVELFRTWVVKYKLM